MAAIDFTVGSRRLLSVRRQLATWSFSLDDALCLRSGELNPPLAGRDGLLIRSAPVARMGEIAARFPRHLIGAREDFARHYIAMDGSFEDYLARFSSKTRSTLRRKRRKLDRETGGHTVTAYRSPAEIERFLELALPLSARTYQARLLGAGLPDSDAARERMLAVARDDKLRCFLLFVRSRPVAYLALPVSGRTLIYAHLGYDPDFARLSPGTVLQFEALEQLFAERRFARFDFTEGEGAHKAMFGTDSVQCASFVLLEPSAANRALIALRHGVDASVATARDLAERCGALGPVRALLRG